jgi:hypothetical protein
VGAKDSGGKGKFINEEENKERFEKLEEERRAKDALREIELHR